MSRAEEIEELPDIDGDRPPRLTREILGHDAGFADFTQSRAQGRLHHSWLLSEYLFISSRLSIMQTRQFPSAEPSWKNDFMRLTSSTGISVLNLSVLRL